MFVILFSIREVICLTKKKKKKEREKKKDAFKEANKQTRKSDFYTACDLLILIK